MFPIGMVSDYDWTGGPYDSPCNQTGEISRKVLCFVAISAWVAGVLFSDKLGFHEGQSLIMYTRVESERVCAEMVGQSLQR